MSPIQVICVGFLIIVGLFLIACTVIWWCTRARPAPKFRKVTNATIESLRDRCQLLQFVEDFLPQPFKELIEHGIYFTDRAEALAPVDQRLATRFANLASLSLHYIEIMVRCAKTGDQEFIDQAAKFAKGFALCASGQWAQAVDVLDELKKLK